MEMDNIPEIVIADQNETDSELGDSFDEKNSPFSGLFKSLDAHIFTRGHGTSSGHDIAKHGKSDANKRRATLGYLNTKGLLSTLTNGQHTGLMNTAPSSFRQQNANEQKRIITKRRSLDIGEMRGSQRYLERGSRSLPKLFTDSSTLDVDDNVAKLKIRFSSENGHTLSREKAWRARRRLSSLRPGMDAGSTFLQLLGSARRRSVSPLIPHHRIPPLQRFRSYVRLTLICVRLCKYSHENVQAARDEYLSIIQVTQDYVTRTEDPDGLFFDPTVFRANKEQRLPADARKILQKDQQLRTEKELEYLHLVLRSIKAFAEYPNNMQKKLCEAGWFEAYEPKRAIVRQGHPPHAFYFILSGSVVVTSFDRKTGGTTFLVALHKGMSFGDFVEIFMSGGIKSMTDPDQNSFIRSIPFLKHWPIECLATNPQACMFHFFGRGQVLVRDSNHSDWIYVVKSGSLSVLKKLVEVHPRTSKRNSESEVEDDDLDRRKSFGTWNFRFRKMRHQSSGEKEVFKNNIEMEKRLEQTLPGYFNARERLGLIDYDTIISDHRSRVLQTNKRASLLEATSLPKLNMLPTESPVPEVDQGETIGAAEDDKLVQMHKIRKTSKGAYLATTKNAKRKSTKKDAIQEELFQKQLEYDKRSLDDRKIGRKTITDELDNKPIKGVTLTEKDLRPMFVEVQVLERGQYFGLTKSVFPEQAESFSVVSNGAECIMISKRIFFEMANESTMHHLRQVETLLPPETELQANLQDFVDWKAHRARVYNRLVKNKTSRVARHSQFPPQFAGQYCYRTGPTVRID
ncbi:uncharacterized protein LOC127865918 isoform X2 [Dreissena polymorpha]|uniref:uncharacterized protein LOC127865918 isoform X2 n=1 Tax=Dreissena polymorpha TaxID=45954 RepID=UPI00226515CD|nr:uncharacterized protein LOC127865918 isoform X2 [Dreissena polymorpha]